MVINYEISQALIDEAYNNCSFMNPYEEQVNFNNNRFLCEMGQKYQLPATTIFQDCLLDDNCQPMGVFQKYGWIQTFWHLDNFGGGYVMSIWFSIEAQFMLNFIFNSLSVNTPTSKKCEPTNDPPLRLVDNLFTHPENSKEEEVMSIYQIH